MWPTLEIRPGYRFNVIVTKDVVFEAPRQGEPVRRIQMTPLSIWRASLPGLPRRYRRGTHSSGSIRCHMSSAISCLLMGRKYHTGVQGLDFF